ncbi:carbonic anhydrase [Hyphobacterium sp.]|uniref:carbonic anhydrase n=1 Tax=Hyphobacterium sp. TaxID=2004662 RepID=UPI003B52A824
MIGDLLENNLVWADTKTRKDPDFFHRLARQQHPDYLWIGCSDSRVPANDIVGLDPGELFVHRNVANLAPSQDANFLSVLQFAVEALKIRHIIVCGHYGCGGVAAAMSGERHGLIDHWLQPIRDVSDELAPYLLRLEDPKRRLDALCEANVAAQVRSVACNPIVHDAWSRGQELAVHGWIYGIDNGLIRDLELTVSNRRQVSRQFPDRLSVWLGADPGECATGCLGVVEA